MEARSGISRRRFLKGLTTAAAMSDALRSAQATEGATAWRGKFTHSNLTVTNDAGKTYLDRIYTRVLRFS